MMNIQRSWTNQDRKCKNITQDEKIKSGVLKELVPPTPLVAPVVNPSSYLVRATYVLHYAHILKIEQHVANGDMLLR